MKACVLEAVAKLIYKDVNTPKPEKGEALVKIRASYFRHFSRVLAARSMSPGLLISVTM